VRGPYAPDGLRITAERYAKSDLLSQKLFQKASLMALRCTTFYQTAISQLFRSSLAISSNTTMRDIPYHQG
jgi:hypothetical protein